MKVACARCHPGAPAGPQLPPGRVFRVVRQRRQPPAVAPPDVAYRGVPTTCAGCHKDPHQGRFGTKCETCHTGDDWKRIQRANFDHGRTRYPLTGKHMSTDCAACHPPGRPRRIADFERCAACHADAHAGQLALRKSGGECGECHTTSGFRPSTYTVALHEATPYPLLGSHRTTKCAACHRTLPPAELERAGVALVRVAPAPKAAGPPAVTQFRFPKSGCQDCHRDPHAGDSEKYLGKEGCLACHALTDWRTVRFDHAVTKFPVAGLHLKVSCLGCHKTQAAGGLAPPSARAWATPPRAFASPGHRSCAPAATPIRISGRSAPAARSATATRAGDRHASTTIATRPIASRAPTARSPASAATPRERAAGKEVMRLKPLGSACTDCHKSTVQPL